MNLLDSGVSVGTVADQFQIGKTTVYEWQQRRHETGDFRSRKPGSVGYGHKVTDWAVFKLFAQTHGHKTQSEMAEAWDGTMSHQTMSRCLQKINFTRKKRPTDTKSEMTSNAQPL